MGTVSNNETERIGNMTNEITKYTSIDELARTAKMLALSGYFSTQGNMDVQVAQLATRILAGNELGFGPFASVNNIYIIKGKPVIGANLMASAVKMNPRYDYRVTRLSDNECVITYYQGGDLLGTSSFTMDNAKKAGLTSKDNWKKWPRNMLFARAMSNGVRLHCPDVFNGNAVYTEDELESEEWSVVDIPAPLPEDKPTPFEKEPEPDTPSEEEYAPDVEYKMTKQQWVAFHKLGRELYANTWDKKRKDLVQGVTTGGETSSKKLTPKEAGVLIEGMGKKLNENN